MLAELEILHGIFGVNVGHVGQEGEQLAEEEFFWGFRQFLLGFYILADEKDGIFEFDAHVLVLTHETLVDEDFAEVRILVNLFFHIQPIE